MILTVQYRNVDYEQRICPHIEPIREIAEIRKSWNAIRGTLISIDSESFKAGDCHDCDSWLIVPRETYNGTPLCVTRKMVEIGD